MQSLLSSDTVLVVFALLLGGLVGAYLERARAERSAGGARKENDPR